MARVLLVDDEESIRYSYRKFLTDAGYDVAVASRLEDAKALLFGNEFEVAIVDRLLGADNGLELVKHIREVQPFCEPILISGYPSFESASKTLQYDVFAYLTKPIYKKSLCETVDDAIRKNRIKKESRHRERVLQSLFDASPDAIVISDLSGRTKFVNPAFTRIFGYSKEELEGRAIPNVPEWDKEKTESERDALLKGRAVKERESQRLKKDGRAIDISITQSICRGRNGEPTDILSIVRDITDQRKIEKQLRYAHKMEAIGTLAGGIAHDFNNLLFIISGYTEMSLGELSEGSLLCRNMKEMQKALKRAKELVQQILTFSRLEEQEKRPMLIQPVVKEALVLLRATLPSTIDIRKNIDNRCKGVLADPTRIHQVIMNLCTNSYHSMREKGGVLEISLSRTIIGDNEMTGSLSLPPGRYIVLTVKDTGHGIEAPVMDRIFEPYFTTKNQREGTGMGLAMVHGIIKSMGGEIKVSSIPMQGSTFSVYLPEVEVHVIEAKTITAEPAKRGNERILIIDDEKEIVELMYKMLGRFGYQVTAKTSSTEALKLFRSAPGRFDLVVTDQTMPGTTGIELSKIIRKIRPDMPIVLCTGFSETITEEKLKAIGIKKYIMKPVRCSEIARIIRSVLDEKKKNCSKPYSSHSQISVLSKIKTTAQ